MIMTNKPSGKPKHFRRMHDKKVRMHTLNAHMRAGPALHMGRCHGLPGLGSGLSSRLLSCVCPLLAPMLACTRPLTSTPPPPFSIKQVCALGLLALLGCPEGVLPPEVAGAMGPLMAGGCCCCVCLLVMVICILNVLLEV